MLPVSAKKSQNTVMPRMSLILYEYQSHTQRLMIACVTRPGASEALYQPGKKILPPGNHLFDNPRQGTSGPDFRDSNPVETRTVFSLWFKLAGVPHQPQGLTDL